MILQTLLGWVNRLDAAPVFYARHDDGAVILTCTRKGMKL